MDEYGGARPKTTRRRPRIEQREKLEGELAGEPSTSGSQPCSEAERRQREEEELLEEQESVLAHLREEEEAEAREAHTLPPWAPLPSRARSPPIDINLAGSSNFAYDIRRRDPMKLTSLSTSPKNLPRTQAEHLGMYTSLLPDPTQPYPPRPDIEELPYFRPVSQGRRTENSPRRPQAQDTGEKERLYEEEYRPRKVRLFQRHGMAEMSPRNLSFCLNEPSGSDSDWGRPRNIRPINDDSDLTEQFIDLSINEPQEGELMWEHFRGVKPVDYKQYFRHQTAKTKATPIPTHEKNERKYSYYKNIYGILYKPRERSLYHKQQHYNWDYFLEEESDSDEC